ncbi:hypothetical protein [Elongatibacter sediminis]|uniref:Phosphagen kinase C-terminal domain-containing protein n=1 Tax=Elongatibacter sediminis TaxID=3119006 RepID=A0AAW9RBR4_9GAMM
MSSRIRLARNIEGFHFPSAMERTERCEVLRVVADVLRDVPGRLYPLNRLAPEHERALRRTKMLFDNRDRFMASAGILDDWPEGRAVFVAADGRAGVWINEEDHLRVFAITCGYDMASAADAVSGLLEVIEQRLTFAFSRRLGFLTSCPGNLGTGMRASVLVPCSPVQVRRLRQWNLELRGARGEGSQVVDGIHAVANRRCLGLSEADILERLDAAIAHAFAA